MSLAIKTSSLIFTASQKYQIGPGLIAAIIHQESSGNTWAFRHEPAFYKRYLSNKGRTELGGYVPPESLCSTYSEKYARATSWGLMQILGQTAREHGFNAVFLSELCDPVHNIDIASKFFRWCIDKTGNTEQALLCYNGGGNKKYPTQVLGHIESGAAQYLFV